MRHRPLLLLLIWTKPVLRLSVAKRWALGRSWTETGAVLEDTALSEIGFFALTELLIGTTVCGSKNGGDKTERANSR